LKTTSRYRRRRDRKDKGSQPQPWEVEKHTKGIGMRQLQKMGY
jgi:hypothetical protein